MSELRPTCRQPVFNLSGRVALVTGASSGLGETFARALARSGAKVVLTARRTDKLELLAQEIVAAGGEAVAVALDVADEASTVAAFYAAEAAFGVVDTVIANAGMNSEGAAIDLPAHEFDRVMAVNVRGPFLTAREAAKRLIADGSREKQHGRIVITASITASVVESGLAAYSASKAGVEQLGKVLAREWVRSGINVNVIHPGYIRTDMNSAWFDSEPGQRRIARFNRRRLGRVEDLEAILLLLASDASAGITGSSFTVDDGQSL